MLESLRGRAYDVIRVLRINNPLITVPECLQAREQVLGVIDNPRELQVKYLTTYQKEEEKLSAYILRPGPLLQKLVERGAVEREAVSQAQLDQMAAEQWTERRRLALPRTPAPGLLELLALMRDDEAAEEEEEEEALLQAELLAGYFT